MTHETRMSLAVKCINWNLMLDGGATFWFTKKNLTRMHSYKPPQYTMDSETNVTTVLISIIHSWIKVNVQQKMNAIDVCKIKLTIVSFSVDVKLSYHIISYANTQTFDVTLQHSYWLSVSRVVHFNRCKKLPTCYVFLKATHAEISCISPNSGKRRRSQIQTVIHTGLTS